VAEYPAHPPPIITTLFLVAFECSDDDDDDDDDDVSVSADACSFVLPVAGTYLIFWFTLVLMVVLIPAKARMEDTSVAIWTSRSSSREDCVVMVTCLFIVAFFVYVLPL